MTALRLRWWAFATGHALMRHWQWFLLAGALVPMTTTLPELLRFVGYPLQQTFEAGHDMGWRLAHIASVQCVAWIWIVVQRRAVSGGDFAPYLLSLPFTPVQRLKVDLAVLVPANALLLVPDAATLAAAYAEPQSHGVSLVMGLAALIALSALLQISFLQKRPTALLPIVLGNVSLSWAFSNGSQVACWTLVAASLVFGVRALARSSSAPSHLRAQMPFRRLVYSPSSALPLSWRIQIRALTSQSASTVRAVSIVAVVVGTHGLLVAFAFDSRTWPTIALALATLSVLVSGWYRTLSHAHAAVSSYLSALPLSKHFWRWRDTRFIAVIGTVPACVILGDALVHRTTHPFASAMLLSGYWILVALLRVPVLRGGRQAVLAAVLVAGAWSAIAVAATS